MNTSQISVTSPLVKREHNKTVYGQIRNRFEDNAKVIFKELAVER